MKPPPLSGLKKEREEGPRKPSRVPGSWSPAVCGQCWGLLLVCPRLQAGNPGAPAGPE